MVTSHFDVASGVRIRLPKVSQKVYDQENKKITLLIDQSGHMVIEGRRVDIKDLKKRLEDLVTKEGLVLIRYRTRDRTTLHAEKCACGRTMVRMEKVLGRTDDMLNKNPSFSA